MVSSKLPELDVLFEDNQLLVVNKPPMLPTMGVAAEDDSLYRRAGEYLRIKHNKPGNAYVGIVSRLDSFVSGVIVLAKRSKAASRLSDQMRRGTIEKRYLAIVPTGLPQQGRLVDRMVKSEPRRKMIALPDQAALVRGEKRAALRFQTVAVAGAQQLLEIQLETGRKHQIRVQLQNAGFPVIGDRKYGSRETFPRGIALHCYQLKFEHPRDKTLQSFQAEPPDWWSMARFRKS